VRLRLTTAGDRYVCTVDVPALDDYLKKAEARGGVVAVPKIPIPESVGWLIARIPKAIFSG